MISPSFWNETRGVRLLFWTSEGATWVSFALALVSLPFLHFVKTQVDQQLMMTIHLLTVLASVIEDDSSVASTADLDD
jgi:hypothetical protein